MKQQVSKTCIPQGIEGSNPSLSENLKAPFWVLFKFWKSGSKVNCFTLRRDLKPGALCEFCRRQRRTSRGQVRAKFPSGNLCRTNPSLSENFVSDFGKFLCLCSFGYFGLRPFTVYSQSQSALNFTQNRYKIICFISLNLGLNFLWMERYQLLGIA